MFATRARLVRFGSSGQDNGDKGVEIGRSKRVVGEARTSASYIDAVMLYLRTTYTLGSKSRLYRCHSMAIERNCTVLDHHVFSPTRCQAGDHPGTDLSGQEGQR